MRIEGPEKYSLTLTPERYTALCAQGRRTFSGLATNNLPKLYIVSIAEKPVYVGITTTDIAARFRIGWKSTGATGYYGYKWRHGNATATLSVWCHMDAPDRKKPIDIETVEAEVVYLIRAGGQWPEFQNEIHFHPSTEVHRKAAVDIMAHFQL